jgi:hypothetical protein
VIFENPAELKERIESLSGRRVYREPDIAEDTSSYMSILGGSVLRLGGNDFFVLGDTWEGRFGIDDQPKFWVKYAVDLTTGEKKIVKLVFSEEFETEFGFIKVRHRRSPEKESGIIELVRDNPRFMQGYTVPDSVGNQVRVIDFIRGKSLYVTLRTLDMPHEEYFHEHLPGVMKELIACIEALAALHAQEQHHGDVRTDHILIERHSGHFIWIDFDYSVNFSDYDIWSMGNVITFVVGKGSTPSAESPASQRATRCCAKEASSKTTHCPWESTALPIWASSSPTSPKHSMTSCCASQSDQSTSTKIWRAPRRTSGLSFLSFPLSVVLDVNHANYVIRYVDFSSRLKESDEIEEAT